MKTNHDKQGSPEQGRKRLDEIAAGINAKFGTHITLPLSKAAAARVMRLPFGILELDLRTGGGVPLNRSTRIWGKPSSLKSTTCLRLIRNAQQHCRHCKHTLVRVPGTGQMDCSCPRPRWTLVDTSQFGILSKFNPGYALDIQHGHAPEGMEKRGEGHAALAVPGNDGKKAYVEFCHADRCEPFRCLLIDTEGSTDEAWARANGVDTDLLLLMGSNWAEQVLDITDEIIEMGEIDFLVLDSLDMLTPGDTLEKALSQTPKVANKAGVMTRAMQKWAAAGAAGGLLNRYTPTTVIVAQVRAKDIGKPWASLAPSGGWAVGHGISLDVKLEPIKFEYKENNALFGTFGCKIAKSRVGGLPRSTGKFRFWLRPGKGRLVGDTEDVETVMEHASKTLDPRLLGKRGTKYELRSGFLPGGCVQMKTLQDVKAFLDGNVSVYLDLRHRVLSYLIGEDIQITMPSEKIDAEEKLAEKKKSMRTVAQARADKKKKGKKEKGLSLDVLELV